MESILQGWLTKSPPEKKQFKLFGSKWRKRYFVLYAPPTVDSIPDAYQAILEYYTSRKLHHKCGTINLMDCEEVLSSLDSDIYRHVFGLRTMHKGQLRTYYLAAETEPEMTKWVIKLCQVLGLTENDDSIGSPQSQFPHRAQPNVRMTQPIKVPGSTRQPFTRPHTYQSPLGTSGIQSPAPPPPRSVPSMLNASVTRLNISEPSLLDATLPKSFTEIRRETVDVDWKMSSPPGAPKTASPPGSSQIRNAESFPELDRFSPTTRKLGNGEGRELPPIPPEKTGPKIVPEPVVDIDYDLPKQKYYDHYKSEGQTDIRNDISSEGISSVPVKGENGVGWNSRAQTSDEWYNLPKSLNSGNDDFYNVPKSQLDKRKHASQGDEFYNVPKSQGSERSYVGLLPQKNGDRGRSYQGQDYEDDYNVPKAALAYSHPQEGYNVPGSKDLVEFDVYNSPKHKSYSQDSRIMSDRPKCFWERETIQGVVNGTQPLPDHMQSVSSTQDYPVVCQPNAPDIIPSLLSAGKPPEKPPRPLSRPSPDRQIVVGGAISIEVDRPVSVLQPDFNYPCLAAEEGNEAEVSCASEEDFGSSSELKKTPSGTFKQNKSTVQSSSSIQKRQAASIAPIHDSIRFTQRTKSFKRSIPSQDRTTLPLPVKRIVERSESSSADSSDEEANQRVAVQSN